MQQKPFFSTLGGAAAPVSYHPTRPLEADEQKRLDELRAKGFKKLTDNEMREFQHLSEMALNHLRTRRGWKHA